MSVDVADEVKEGWRAAVSALDRALDAFVTSEGEVVVEILTSALNAAVDVYEQWSDALEEALSALDESEDEASELVLAARSEALAAGAAVDELLMSRALVMIGLYEGLEPQDRAPRINSVRREQLCGGSVSAELVFSSPPRRLVEAATGGMPVDSLHQVAPWIWPSSTPMSLTDRVSAELAVWRPVAETVNRGLDVVFGTGRSLAFDMEADHLATAAGWLSEGARPVWRLFKASVANVLVTAALKCFRRMLKKLRVAAERVFRSATEFLRSSKNRAFELLDGLVRASPRTLDVVPTIESARRHEILQNMRRVAVEHRKWEWRVLAFAAEHAVPIASFSVPAVAGFPVWVILVAGLAAADLSLVEGTLRAIFRVAAP